MSDLGRGKGHTQKTSGEVWQWTGMVRERAQTSCNGNVNGMWGKPFFAPSKVNKAKKQTKGVQKASVSVQCTTVCRDRAYFTWFKINLALVHDSHTEMWLICAVYFTVHCTHLQDWEQKHTSDPDMASSPYHHWLTWLESCRSLKLLQLTYQATLSFLL